MAAGLERRDFLKLLGWSGAALATGCAPDMPDLIPYVRPQQNLTPGKPTWFATTCRQCPSGCGMIAKNVDGRVIKLEGNPLHPINGGKLCPRGQAALTGLYNPDRLREPMQRMPDGQLAPLDWQQAVGILAQRLKGAGGKIAFLTPLITGTLRERIRTGLSQAGAGPETHVMYEPYTYEALKAANRTVFGQDALPTYHFDRADFLISFGADFLETWLSQVEYARRFALFHGPRQETKGFFVYVGPRRSITAANADHMLFVAPGTEHLAAAGILKAWSEIADNASMPPAQRAAIEQATRGHSVQSAAQVSGASEADLRRIAERLVQARRPLAIASGNGILAPNAVQTAIAADLICALHPASLELIDFAQPHALGEAAPIAQVQRLAERMHNREIDLLLIHEANPVFTLAGGRQFGDALAQVPHVISFSCFPDETGQYAQLHLPTHHFLEEWGDFEPKPGISGLVQPTMGPVFQTMGLADILASGGFGAPNGPDGFKETLQAAWRQRADGPFTLFWVQSLRQGGQWRRPEAVQAPSVIQPSELPGMAPIQAAETGDRFRCIVYPTIQFYDGRLANSPWLQEFPDPITQITWGGWVEMHPDDAAQRALKHSDVVQIQSPYGSIRVPVLPLNTVPRGSLAVPIGQGHTHFGRFADGMPDNPFRLLPERVDENGQIPGNTLTVSLTPQSERFALAGASGSLTDHGRHFVVTVDLDEYRQAEAEGRRPLIAMPLPEGYDPHVDVVRPHQHGQYRWAMIVDLDRCIGCGACVVACYAENNVAFVGRRQMLKMREMSWIRVQRYFEPDTWQPRWLIMLCQHCDSAPCEAVCPVYAPHHSEEGLNNQVYNRCFGTRFCSQNDPYKVRRFNWFTWTRPFPMQMQLNPDVTVRQKGIMEKCSFCIQRIVQAKIDARNQDRPVRDGDFTTACAQTCPTDALIFGNLLDPSSRVSKMIKDPRAYQVLHHLNTKPAVIYLKRLTQEL